MVIAKFLCLALQKLARIKKSNSFNNQETSNHIRQQINNLVIANKVKGDAPKTTMPL